MRESYVLSWISSVSEHRPDLNGFSICPFAKSYSFKIVSCSIYDIKPLEKEYGVVIFIVEDDLTHDFLQKKCDELNNKHEKYSFFIDCPSKSNFIGNVQTNNQKYNLILYQNTKLLRKLRESLAKTNYYDEWDEEYLKEILHHDYKMVKNIRNNTNK